MHYLYKFSIFDGMEIRIIKSSKFNNFPTHQKNLQTSNTETKKHHIFNNREFIHIYIIGKTIFQSTKFMKVFCNIDCGFIWSNKVGDERLNKNIENVKLCGK
jgi:hypothetical protein